jgi:hypothetical protein
MLQKIESEEVDDEGEGSLWFGSQLVAPRSPTDADLGACAACRHYRDARPHSWDDSDGSLTIACEVRGRVKARTDISSHTQCASVGKLRLMTR